jgi:hypothetical protein
MAGWRSAALTAALLLSSLGTAAVALGQAHSRTTVSFSIATKWGAGKGEHFSYGVRNAPKGSALALQRESGTSGPWRTVKQLHSRSGSGTAPALAIGLYGMRVAVIKNGRVVAQKSKTVYVYGDIDFKALCDAPNVQWQNNDGGCNATAAQVGQNLFPSAATFDAPGSSSPSAPATNILVSPSTSCRSMTLQYGESNADDQHAGGNMQITQTVVQEHSAPNTSVFAGGTLQTTTVKLDGGAFEITDESTYTGSGSLEVLENGTLNCYTSDGAVPGA